MLRLLLVTLLLTLTACSAEPDSRDPLQAWQPDLQGPIRELESLLQTLNQQADINRVSSQLAVLYDASLYQLYLRKRARMTVEERDLFDRDQRAFLVRRERVSREAGEPFRSGSIAPFIRNQAFIDETRARLDEVRQIRVGRS